jgi:hypothetical protein
MDLRIFARLSDAQWRQEDLGLLKKESQVTAVSIVNATGMEQEKASELARERNKELASTVLLITSLDGMQYSVVASKNKHGASMTVFEGLDGNKNSEDYFIQASDPNLRRVRNLNEQGFLSDDQAKPVLEFFDRVVKNLLPES